MLLCSRFVWLGFSFFRGFIAGFGAVLAAVFAAAALPAAAAVAASAAASAAAAGLAAGSGGCSSSGGSDGDGGSLLRRLFLPPLLTASEPAVSYVIIVPAGVAAKVAIGIACLLSVVGYGQPSYRSCVVESIGRR